MYFYLYPPASPSEGGLEDRRVIEREKEDNDLNDISNSTKDNIINNLPSPNLPDL